MSAIRVARGFTGRTKVVKFAGNYHGHGDALLAAGGSGVATLGLSGSAGVTAEAVSETIVAPYNVVPELDDDVACVIVEPVAANMGLVAPAPRVPRRAARGLRRRGRAAGVRRGDHRVPPRRRAGRRSVYGVQPDLSCFGKVIGGGLTDRRLRWPGRRHGGARTDRPRVPGGHLVGEPAGDRRRAGRPRRCSTPTPTRCCRPRPAGWPTGCGRPSRPPGCPSTCRSCGPLLGLHFSTRPAVDYDTAKTTDEALYARLLPRHAPSAAWPSRRGRTRSPSLVWPTATMTSTPWSRRPRKRPSRWPGTVGVSVNQEQVRYWNEEGADQWLTRQDRLDTMLAVFLRSPAGGRGGLAGRRTCSTSAAGAVPPRSSWPASSARRAGDGPRRVPSPPRPAAGARRGPGVSPTCWCGRPMRRSAPLPAGHFDVVASRFGVMFFDDPVAAFANLARATKPGGRLAFVCWQPVDRNPWFAEPLAAAMAVVPDPKLPPPGGPGPFAFSYPDRVCDVLRAGGFDAIDGRVAHGGARQRDTRRGCGLHDQQHHGPAPGG